MVLGVLIGALARSGAGSAEGYVEGIAGMARTVESDTAYAGLAAWRLNDRLHLIGEVGRLRDAIGQDLADRLALVEAGIVAANQRTFGTEFPVVFEARVPAWYGFGGLRVAGPSAATGRITTSLEGGAGSARLDPQVHLTIDGENLDSEAAAITGLGDGTQQLGSSPAAAAASASKCGNGFESREATATCGSSATRSPTSTAFTSAAAGVFEAGFLLPHSDRISD